MPGADAVTARLRCWRQRRQRRWSSAVLRVSAACCGSGYGADLPRRRARRQRTRTPRSSTRGRTTSSGLTTATGATGATGRGTGRGTATGRARGPPAAVRRVGAHAHNRPLAPRPRPRGPRGREIARHVGRARDQETEGPAGVTRSPRTSPRSRGHDHGIPDVTCEECDLSPAAITCGICGILCDNCSNTYPRFKKLQSHHVIKLKSALFAPKQPLRTDNPIINRAHTAAPLYQQSSGAAEEILAAQREARVRQKKARVAH
eukprot:TRINITY_DN628_c0_g1_i5.p1 TRINITY_DN628_c0_g1~~TRINITY_DN628_c0_g1_i5.p1  ORF type:complete len:295 (+),score=14.17 TRINITY_DN628_c0_g1_i5:103-885(+)